MAPEFPVGAYRSAESAAAALEAAGLGAVIRRAVASDRLRANVLIGRAPGLAPVASPREPMRSDSRDTPSDDCRQAPVPTPIPDGWLSPSRGGIRPEAHQPQPKKYPEQTG